MIITSDDSTNGIIYLADASEGVGVGHVSRMLEAHQSTTNFLSQLIVISCSEKFEQLPFGLPDSVLFLTITSGFTLSLNQVKCFVLDTYNQDLQARVSFAAREKNVPLIFMDDCTNDNLPFDTIRIKKNIFEVVISSEGRRRYTFRYKKFFIGNVDFETLKVGRKNQATVFLGVNYQDTRYVSHIRIILETVANFGLDRLIVVSLSDNLIPLVYDPKDQARIKFKRSINYSSFIRLCSESRFCLVSAGQALGDLLLIRKDLVVIKSSYDQTLNFASTQDRKEVLPDCSFIDLCNDDVTDIALNITRHLERVPTAKFSPEPSYGFSLGQIIGYLV